MNTQNPPAKSEAWHRACTNPNGDCGVTITERRFDADDAPVATEAPAADGVCPLCGAPWGPWTAGPADDEDEGDE